LELEKDMRRKRWVSLVLKQFTATVSVFEGLANWMSKRVRRSYWVSSFEISRSAYGGACCYPHGSSISIGGSSS
jgi:hypothetical protein